MFRLDESRPVAMPLAMKLHKRKPEEDACYPTISQSMIRSRIYAMTGTRADIAYASGVLSQYNHDLSNDHTIAFKRVFRYLNGKKDWRVRFPGALVGANGGAIGESSLGGEEESSIRCYVDSDYVGCPDDCNLTSGPVITIGGVVDCRSRK
jgi:hypothetical protein